jgi:hypothetical protein
MHIDIEGITIKDTHTPRSNYYYYYNLHLDKLISIEALLDGYFVNSISFIFEVSDHRLSVIYFFQPHSKFFSLQ